MKISGDHPLVNLEAYVKNTNKKEKLANASNQVQQGSFDEEKVILSPKARAVQEAKKMLSSIPDVREEKVAEIKRQIDQGTYTVNSEKIASKMIQDSLLNELL